MQEMTYLTEKNTVVSETAGGFLTLTVNGETFEGVQLVRTFPFTAAEEFISARAAGEDAQEIGMIRSLQKDFGGQAGEILRKQLAIRYFTPKIRRICSVKEEAGCSYFEVDTDAGVCKFAVRSNDNSFTKLTETRIFIQDLENNRFEIPDITALTAKERKKVDIFL